MSQKSSSEAIVKRVEKSRPGSLVTLPEKLKLLLEVKNEPVSGRCRF